MKILITGATGYLGSRLTQRLQQEGHVLVLLVREPKAIRSASLANMTIHKGDITDPASIAKAMEGCTHVYHTAAVAKYQSSGMDRFYEVNVTGTRNILEAAMRFNIQKLVFTSSAAVFGPSLDIPLTEKDPRIESFESDYDFSKHLAGNLVREFVQKGLNAVIVNPSRVFGPGPATYSNGVTRMIRYLLTKKILFIPEIGAYRSNYSFIEDVVDGHVLAMQKGKAGESYILGGENISYAELFNSVAGYSSSKCRLIKIPVDIIKGAAHFTSLFNRNTELTASLITRFAKHRMLNSRKAISELGYRITPFQEGLHLTIDYLKNYAP